MNYEKIDRTAAMARIASKQARVASWSARAQWAATKGEGFEHILAEAQGAIEQLAEELAMIAQAIEDETTTCVRCGWKCSMCRCAEGPKRP